MCTLRIFKLYALCVLYPLCEFYAPCAINHTLSMFQVSEGASGQQALPQSTSRHSNMSSVADVTESWEFRSALEAPIATLESLDEIDRQVKKCLLFFQTTKQNKLNFLLWFEVKIVVACDLHFSAI